MRLGVRAFSSRLVPKKINKLAILIIKQGKLCSFVAGIRRKFFAECLKVGYTVQYQQFVRI
jgi:hypothetical protein